MTRLAALLLLLFVATPTELVTREAFLMGTRVQLAVRAPARGEGLATLDRALRILEQTERELSTWRDDSDISELNRQPIGIAWTAPARTCRTLRDAFSWVRETGGAFDPTLGRPASFALDENTCRITKTAAAAIDVGAFGKGEALDRVETALGAGAWMIDLGGQLSVGGPQSDGEPWPISIAHPIDRGAAFTTVMLSQGSLSTSGDSERGAHITDPTTRKPATFKGSVTVWHRRGLAADALSTALYVMGPDTGLRWANERGIAALYLVPQVASGFSRKVATRASAAWRSAYGD